MKGKNKQKGGAREGAGRPATGKNTVTISFSVHKDAADQVKAAVKQAVAEFKAKNPPKLKENVVPDVKKEPVKESVPMKKKPEIAPKQDSSPAIQSFLDKRRAGKLK